MRRLLAAAFCMFAATPLPAQERVPRTAETIEVSIVNVDVVVTDRKGNPVRGLTKDDFEVREGGKPRAITNFTEYSPEAREGGDAAVAPPEKRTIVVFIEAFGLPRFSIDPMFDALRDAMKKIVRPGDAAAIYTWAGGATLLRAGFTDDVDTLDAKLEEIAEESVGVAANEFASAAREIAFEHAFYDSVATAGPMGPAAAARGRAAAEESRAMEDVELYKIRRKAEALQSLMRAIAGAEGKKIVISATNRFGVHAAADRFPDGTVPFHKRADFDTRRFREAVARTANAYGITVYPIYPAGLQWTPRADASQVRPDDTALARDNNILMNETSSLQELAAATGGVMAWGAKDAASLMPRIVEDLQSYYSLAYRATGATAGAI
ncbi:MAG TPA: VWA domain-containing protein, partial [Thermoanaerobaculia bacterium]|nr:VWA domain-containing protein [Thermoanaerobaculia bacterium]